MKKTTIEGTPFTMVTTENGNFLALGNYRLTELITKEECYKNVSGINWNFLLTVLKTVEAIENTKNN